MKKVLKTKMKLIVTGWLLLLLVTGSVVLVDQHSVQAAPEAPQAPEPVSNGISKLTNISRVFAEVAKKVKPTVVSITTEKVIKYPQQQYPRRGPSQQNPFDDFFDRFFRFPAPEGEQRQKALGSGVIMTPDGYIVTNNHVVANFDKIKVTLADERTFDAEVVGTDPKSDMAVIKIDAKDLPAVKVGDSDKAEVGEWVLAIGNPMGFAHTVTAGIISAKGRSNLRLADYEDFIQTDAAINPGNSGGALVNLNGELVGINTAIASQTGTYIGIGFAIPINMAKNIMESLVNKGKVVRGWLGVYIQDIGDELADAMGLKDTKGSLISSVVEDSPSEKAGLKAGDVIIRLDKEKIKDSNHLRNIIAGLLPGTTVKVEVIRNKKKRVISVKLGELEDKEQVAEKSAKQKQEKMGLKVEALTRELAQQYGYDAKKKGVIVTEVKPGGPAARGTVREGDLILELNRKEIKSITAYEKAIASVKPGDTILVLLNRRGSVFFVGVKIPKK